MLELMRLEKEKTASESVMHQHQHMKERVTGLRRTHGETAREKQPEEIFHMENAYGNIALGMDAEGYTTLVLGRKKHQNGPTVNREQKELDRQRSSAWNHASGHMYANPRGNVQGAFVFSADKKKLSGERLVRESGVFGFDRGQGLVDYMMNFRGQSRDERRNESGSDPFRRKLESQMNLAIRRAEKQRRRRKDDPDKNNSGVVYKNVESSQI